MIYVGGYDPQGAEGYYRLFQRGWKRFLKVWPITAGLGELEIDSNDIAHWNIQATGPNWQVATRYEFLRQEHVIGANLSQPMPRQLARAILWILGDLVSGTSLRIFRASWRFGLHLLYFQFLLVTWIAVAVAAGWVAGGAAAHATNTFSVGLLVAAVTAIMSFAVLRPLADRWFVVRINNTWPYMREFARGRATYFARPIDAGAKRLVAAAGANSADEILIIGHSGGAAIAIAMIARALELDPDLGRRGPRVALLTLGSTLSGATLHPGAAKLREFIRRLSVEPSVLWIDCQSRHDFLSFWAFDPVEGVGVHVGTERCNPLIWQVRFRDVVSPEVFRRLRWSFFRMHFQFIMAGDRRAPYDYYMLVCGPVPVTDWATRGHEVIAAFSPDATYAEASAISPPPGQEKKNSGSLLEAD